MKRVSSRELLLTGIVSLGLCVAPSLGLGATPVEWEIEIPSDSGVTVSEQSDAERGETVWRIENSSDESVTLALGRLDSPRVAGKSYAVEGFVRYEAVVGQGYLEMWSVFGEADPGTPSQRYFSRTLASEGPTQSLEGSSDWRAFQLPFFLGDAPRGPQHLEFNLHLPGRGTVWLTAGRLLDGEASAWNGVSGHSGWWSGRMSGWIGGVLGAFCGLVGAISGALAGRGKAKGLVLGLTYGLLGLGAVSLMAGVVAWSLNQPREVWYVLVLLGVVLSLVIPLNLKNIGRAYEQAELKKMKSLDSLG